MHDRHEKVLRRELAKADAVQPAPTLAQILIAARRREAWILALVFTMAALGALLVLAGLLLMSGQEQPPAPTPTSSTRLWEA